MQAIHRNGWSPQHGVRDEILSVGNERLQNRRMLAYVSKATSRQVIRDTMFWSLNQKVSLTAALIETMKRKHQKKFGAY